MRRRVRRALAFLIPALVAMIAAGVWPPERVSPYLVPVLSPLYTLEWNGYDAFFNWRGATPQTIDPRIVIIGFENASKSAKQLLTPLGDPVRWPPPRRYHAGVLDNLVRAGAKIVVFDVLMVDPSPNPADDKTFADALSRAARAGTKVILACRIERSGTEQSKTVLAPYHNDSGVDFEEHTEIAFVEVVPDADRIVRRLYPLQKSQGQWLPSLAAAAFLAETGRDINASQLTRENILLGGDPIPRTGPDVLDFLDAENRMGTAYMDFPAGISAFPIVRYETAYEPGPDPRFTPGAFKDKIVFIGVTGVELTQAQNDYFRTAYSRFHLEDVGGTTSSDVYGVVVQAQMLNAMLKKTFIRHARPYEIFLLVFAFCALGTLGVRFYMNWRGPAVMVAAIAGYIAVSFALFVAQRIYVPWVLPGGMMLLAVAAVAYVGRAEIRRQWASYVSPTYLEAMLRTDYESRPERLDATVLFGDIRGFTNFSEQHDPETVVALLDKHLEKLTPIVFDEKGAIDKFLGDGILAVFGAPRLASHPVSAQENALHAVRAACRMQESALIPIRDADGTGYVFATGFGVATGPLLFGNVGAGKLKTFTLIGDTVNFASRLQGVTGKPDVLIDAATYALIADSVEVEPLHDVRVKGKEEAFTCYAVKKIRP